MIPPTIDAWRGPVPPGHSPANRTRVLSPELALVDPELRREALALLPALRPYDFLERRPLDAARLEPQPPAASPVVERSAGRSRPVLAVAVAAYLASAILRTAAFELALFACIALVVFVVNLAA